MVSLSYPFGENRMITEVKNQPLTPMEIAKREVAEEQNKAAVIALKDVYRKKDAAEKVLANINREIADLEARIEDGTFNIE